MGKNTEEILANELNEDKKAKTKIPLLTKSNILNFETERIVKTAKIIETEIFNKFPKRKQKALTALAISVVMDGVSILLTARQAEANGEVKNLIFNHHHISIRDIVEATNREILTRTGELKGRPDIDFPCFYFTIFLIKALAIDGNKKARYLSDILDQIKTDADEQNKQEKEKGTINETTSEYIAT